MNRILAGVAFLLVLWGATFSSVVRSEEAKRFAPEEKMRILSEGRAHPDQINELCKKYGITQATYIAWVNQSRGSADRNDGQAKPAPAPVRVAGGAPPSTPAGGAASTAVSNLAKDLNKEVTYGIGTESFRGEPSDAWQFYGTYKNYLAFRYDHPAFVASGRGTFEGFQPLMGAAVGATKGRDAISVELLAPIGPSSDTFTNLDVLSESAQRRFLDLDVRYLRSVNKYLAIGAAYWLSFDCSNNQWWYRDEEVLWRNGTYSQGPGLAAALNIPLWEKELEGKLQLTGSLLFSPTTVYHDWVLNNSPRIDVRSQTHLGLYANPEVGLRYEFMPNASIDAGWRCDLSAPYGTDTSRLLQGPTVSLSLHW